ncbi:serine/threonine-protein kinase [Microbispora hainanensis]|uniref:non-specific serine/threonine protein kinase n=1 Tax=Microbispora hainanensis TaxID=568844 RepID=A0ABZ1SWB8_9ACTN|nr:protein kinase [Microbispora hainanensis]
MSRAEGRLVGGRYQLVEPIGRGGMGVVWRAHDQLLDRAVAVKEVRYDSAMGDELSDLNRRTMREARAAGRLTHPNVVVVHDVIEEDDRPWIIMQLVPSRSLGQVIREDGPLSAERTVEIGLQILDALRAAHRQGVLHRDVKPENVLLTDDGRVVLTDFGIARLEADSTMTRTGLVGTPAFIAPERLRGEAAQRESDLWSLGATLYTAVEGKPPHDRGMAMATMHAVLNDDPAPPRRAGALGSVLQRMLAKEPADRPGYDELIRLLKRAARELAPPPSRPAAEPASPQAAKPEAAKPETPASRQGKASRGAAPYPPVSPSPASSPEASSSRRDEAAERTPAAGEGGAAGRGGALRDAAGPGEITSPLPVIRDDAAPGQADGPAQERPGKTPAAMPETGAQAAPPARTTPSTGTSAKGRPGKEDGRAADADAGDGTTRIAPAASAGSVASVASGGKGRNGQEGSSAAGKAKDSGASSGERPATTASGSSATPKGATDGSTTGGSTTGGSTTGGSTTGGSAASKAAAGSASSASSASSAPSGSSGSFASSGSTGSGSSGGFGGSGGGSRTSRPYANDRPTPGAGDERPAATADRTQESSGVAGSPIAGLRQASPTIPPQDGAAWQGSPTSLVVPRSSNSLLKVALILVPALLVIAGVAGYLGLRAGEGDSGSDPAAGPNAAAAVGGGDTPSAAEPSSAAPNSPEPSASEEETKSPEPSPSPKTSEPAGVPDGWHKYKHSSGFSIALPKGWHVDGRGNGEVRFRGDSHTYLEVHHTTSPESDALKVWRRDVPGMSRNFPGYKLVEIREVKGFWKTAADWEFTFGDSRYRSRVIDRGFVTDKHNGYALLYKTQDKDWKKKKELFETIASTFKPAK